MLGLKCYKAFKNTERAIKARVPNPEQKLLIEQQRREVRMEVAGKIISGVAERTEALNILLFDELTEIEITKAFE